MFGGLISIFLVIFIISLGMLNSVFLFMKLCLLFLINLCIDLLFVGCLMVVFVLFFNFINVVVMVVVFLMFGVEVEGGIG